jgi:Mn2+/Fe2+ NRAMP family transporter
MRADTYLEWRYPTSSPILSWDTGALLHAHGVTRIETATQATEALRPVGGEFAFLLLAAGIIGTGLLAVPVLAGSVGYALAEIAS